MNFLRITLFTLLLAQSSVVRPSDCLTCICCCSIYTTCVAMPAYEKGKREGYEKGYEKGDSERYQNGYYDGYKKGYEKGEGKGFELGKNQQIKYLFNLKNRHKIKEEFSKLKNNDALSILDFIPFEFYQELIKEKNFAQAIQERAVKCTGLSNHQSELKKIEDESFDLGYQVGRESFVPPGGPVQENMQEIKNKDQ